ncbi:hypothetical protein FI667_g1958, partial [Globisporangium splendens]
MQSREKVRNIAHSTLARLLGSSTSVQYLQVLHTINQQKGKRVGYDKPQASVFCSQSTRKHQHISKRVTRGLRRIFSMSKEGFLIAHEEQERSAIYYCVLGEGRLQFFSRRFSGVLVRELTLSRSKLKIRGVPDEDARGCPFSFTVQLQRARIQDGRQIVVGKPELLVLSAPSWGERKAWGNAIHAWQRNYWGDPQHQAANMDDEELEAFFLAQHKALEGALQVSMEFSSPEYYSDVKRAMNSSSNTTSAASQQNGSHNSSSNSARRSAKKKAAAAAVSRMLFNRAQAVKSIGSHVGKKIRATRSAVSFSLPPMGVSFASAAPQQPAH